MAYYHIENFRGGLDSRKSPVTLPPGALFTCQNAHINQGGEIEKRQAFVRGLLPATTFGLEASDAGLTTFGSYAQVRAIADVARASNVATITVAAGHGITVGDLITVAGCTDTTFNVASAVVTAALVGGTTISYANAGSNKGTTADTTGSVQWDFTTPSTAIGTTIQYQQLQHPAVQIYGFAFNGTYHALTSVPWSCCFLGKCFVEATFSGGSTFLFYNGIAIVQSYTGMMLQLGVSSSVSTAQQNLLQAYVGSDFVNAINSLNNGFVAFKDAIAFPSGPTANGPTQFVSDLNATEVGAGETMQGVSIISPANVTFTITPTFYNYVNSPPLTDFQVAWVGPVPAYAGSITLGGGSGNSGIFTLSGGSAGYFDFRAPPTYMVANGKTPATVVSLTGGPVIVGAGNTGTQNATAVAAAINALTAYHGFSAWTAGAGLVIYVPQLSSNYLSSLNVTNYTWPLVVGQTYNVINVGNLTATPTSSTFAAANYAYPAVGNHASIGIGGTLAQGGNYWRLDFTTTGTAGNFTIGRGNLQYIANGIVYTNNSTLGYCLTFNNQVILANQGQFNFCTPGDPTGWEKQNLNAGYLPFTSNFGASDTVQSLAPYQGKLAVFGQQSVQIWNWSADPNSQSIYQTLSNVGTIAPGSVQNLGDLDVLFLAPTGIRSLRARDLTLNAFVNDIGSPVDGLVSDDPNACSVVDPQTGRYWLYTQGTIFVLSYYPMDKIVAWSTYLPTWNNAGTQTAFTPKKFTVYKQQVFARDSAAVYAYGNTNPVSSGVYDNCVATVQLPWLDSKRPGTKKAAKGVDVVCGTGVSAGSAIWNIYYGADVQTWFTGNQSNVPPDGYALAGNYSNPSYDSGGCAPITAEQTHFSFYATCNSAVYSVLSQLVYYYDSNYESI